jgi:8-oxo-dGTP pyrophosphatase MutT (NUDIX family)
VNDILAVLDKYLALHPEDKNRLSLLSSQLAKGEDVTIRKNFTGHVTGSGLVLSPDRKKILLVYHKFFQRWIQPGGHIDPGDATPFDTAIREVREETGAEGLTSLSAEEPPVPIDIDVHHISANQAKDEPEHRHYDFRYAFIADSENIRNEDDGIAKVEWVPLEDSRIQLEPWMRTRLPR